MSRAAIVLCGGRSTRMQRDKATLPFGPETMLERIVRTVSEVVDEVWVVAREGQPLPGDFRIARDPEEGLGPLAGLVAGLEACRAERAFLTSCDVPLLRAAYAARLLDLSEMHDVAVPVVDGHTMVTSAVYSRAVLPAAKRLLAERRLRPLFLLEAADTRRVTEDELRDVDPRLDSLLDCNTPETYRTALERAGFAPEGV
ncbi:MAG: molybdenum cofactor guanylyltransferase [Myxococcota bacterium]|nr:molybdenum cofactor guanylyltransferase [Myxococcota bacterium]